jgi:RNA polymerase sigma-70 factor (ECF subfamily)
MAAESYAVIGGDDSGRSATMSSSLLERLKVQDAEAWRRLVRLYYPTVRTWCSRSGLQFDDAADTAQEVFRVLAGKVGRFQRDGGKNSFRAWVWGITKRILIAHWRRQKKQLAGAGGSAAQQWLAEVPESVVEEPSAAEVLSERNQILRRALVLLRAEVEERTWNAFWRVVVDGHAPGVVADELGMTLNSVYLAKARLLRRLREEFGGLIDLLPDVETHS